VTEVPLQDGARDVDDTESARVPAGVAHHRAKHRKRWFRRKAPTQDAYVQIRQLLIWQLCALAGQVIAVALARQEHREIAEIISDISLAAMYGRALWALTSSHLHRATRNAAVVCLGLGPTLFWRATNPMLFTGFDEQLHMRTLGDILSSHELFQPNPLLEVSPRYPGLEAVALLVHQAGIPTMAAATVVVIVCRLVLVTVLCDTVERLTGSERAGGLAVAVYAMSSQFVFFNSQFAYQTMSLPLALAAVTFIARARSADKPLPLLAGATLCLLAVAVTHHVTSFLTAGLLFFWAGAEGGKARLWILYGACASIASTFAWAIVQRRLLSDYFGPIIADVRVQFVGGERRELFKDSAGTASRSFDQYVLLYYAAALSAIVLVMLVPAYRERHHQQSQLRLLIVLSASIPALLAARVVPKGGELFDRSNSFLFIPFSLTVGGFAAWYWWREPHHFGFQEHRRAVIIRIIGVLLAAGTFVGGYVLGSGPSWAHLPGPYIPAADTRSMDAESLAAAQWAREALPAGSRVAADRVSSVLLGAQAGLWPVADGPRDIEISSLYLATTWGTAETDAAGAMRLNYIYVDRRMAEHKPPFGSYFFNGEPNDGKQLTPRQVTKFDEVPGISIAYRHGPVTIYDLNGLGYADLRSGWFGTTPKVAWTTQLAVGLWCGLFIALVIRSRLWPRIRDTAGRVRAEWDPAMTGAALLASASLVSVFLVLFGVWLTPLTIYSGAAVLIAANFGSVVSWVRRTVGGIPRRAMRIAAVLAPLMAVVVAAALWIAGTEDIVKVRHILADPAAIHVTPEGPSG